MSICAFTAMETSFTVKEKEKKAPKRRRTMEDSGDTAKRRSARVRNTKCKKEEKIDFQELLFKYLPSRYCHEPQGNNNNAMQIYCFGW